MRTLLLDSAWDFKGQLCIVFAQQVPIMKRLVSVRRLAVLLSVIAAPLVVLAAASDTIHYLTTFGTPLVEGTTPGTFRHPRALAYDPSGRLYIGDDTGRIQIYGSNHSPLYRIDPPLEGFAPIGIAVDAGGRVLVSDAWNDKLMLFQAATSTAPPQLVAAV